ncbi:MAG TPA: GNAT family N-acetyltransferase [Lentzea sp.]|nr:GNAT family N-acetyltransferase [Lentzea sp.]HUQ58489.1 GNAT family N-acetyltransferase [Lentzea sp.]
MTIRRARPDDLPSLTRRLGQEPYFAERLDRQANGRGVLLTAWHAEVLVGVVYLWLEEAEEPEILEHLPETPLITHLEVHPEHRGAKVGTRLIAAAERILVGEGHTRVALAVEVTNAAAAKLYAKLGFRDWSHGRVKCYSPGDVNGHRRVEICEVMVKPLDGWAGTCSGTSSPDER